MRVCITPPACPPATDSTPPTKLFTMKAVILAGGFGTRISEESAVRPKPMIEIGHKPILWHIMSIYSHHGINDFIICLGYKGHVIKEYFANYFLGRSDVRIDFTNNRIEYLTNHVEPWTISLVDTGDNSMTGGRLKRVRDHVGGETFCMTYGDGVGDVDIPASIRLHREADALCTMTAVQPPGRYGAFALGANDAQVTRFHEKPAGDGAWINGGFFVLSPAVFDYIRDDSTSWEQEPMKRLASDGKLCAFKHSGFWQSMDTLRDKMVLEEHWASGNAPWAVWNNNNT
jgi:glucose-1-phosphate cytidylyltransferase